MNRCVAYIHISHLLHNLNLLENTAHADGTIMMVKANAYGHGLRNILPHFKEKPSKAFGVACISEALKIREICSKNPIYLFDGGASSDDMKDLLRHNITPVISNAHTLKTVLDFKQNLACALNIHIKIDTGFIRNGFYFYDILSGKLDHLFARIKESKNITLTGLAMHFCAADEEKNNFSNVQIKRFKDVIVYLNERGLKARYIHSDNSAAILRGTSKELSDLHIKTLIRPGLSLYGLSPLKASCNLKPVMTVIAKIVDIKKISVGQGVGYNHTFIAKKDMTVAIISFGYGDGLRRGLSNNMHVLINDEPAPIIGTISMDFCCVDITKVLEKTKVNSNDQAVIIGGHEKNIITAQMHAQKLNTIPYEILTGINERVPRIVKY